MRIMPKLSSMINKFIIILLNIIIITSCGTNQPNTLNQTQLTDDTKQLHIEQYFIGVDDRVQVNVWKHPDLSVTVPVRPDGKISVPLIGEVLAGGRSPADVSDEIRNKLTKFIKQPNVAVILEELNSHEFLSRVRVTGAVIRPLSITYRQGMTVLDVILESGGLNEFASGNSTKLFRRNNGNTQSFNIDLDDIFNDGDMTTNYPLKPGDIISVPERTF